MNWIDVGYYVTLIVNVVADGECTRDRNVETVVTADQSMDRLIGVFVDMKP